MKDAYKHLSSFIRFFAEFFFYEALLLYLQKLIIFGITPSGSQFRIFSHVRSILPLSQRKI